MTQTTQIKLSQRIFKLLNIQGFSEKEKDKIMDWRKVYSDDEIMAALEQAVQAKAEKPLTDYTTTILSNNRKKGSVRQRSALLPRYYITNPVPAEEASEITYKEIEEIERLYDRILQREKMYVQNGYGGNLALAEKRLKELRQEIQAMKGE